MPAIVISGYFGAGNAGDEAILAAMLQALRREMPGVEITVIAKDPARTNTLHDVPAVGRFSLAGIWRALGRAELLLSGGGGLLQDSYPRRLLPASILYYLGVCLLAKMRGCRVMFYAQGIGPLKGALARRLVRFVADRVDLITVRDEESALLLARVGVRKPPVRVTADPVLAWSPRPREDIFPLPGLEVDGAPYMVINARPWPGVDFPRTIGAAADRARGEWGAIPVFVPFAPEDAAVGALIRQSMRERLVILPHWAPEAIYAVVANALFLLGMRLHALIFAARAGVPLTGLAYDPKVAGFLRSLGLKDFCRPLSVEPDELWQVMTAAKSRGSGLYGAEPAALRERAAETARHTRELLQSVLI